MLLLDEPLAGLDWKARMEVAETLKLLKKNCTILVVSHDLRELSPLVSAEQLRHPDLSVPDTYLCTASLYLAYQVAPTNALFITWCTCS